MRNALWLTVLMTINVSAYSSEDDNLEIWRQQGVAEPKIQFLGVGGWLLHWHAEGLLLAPSFSNPAALGIEGLPPLWVEADKKRIDQYMPPASDVTLLLVGHGHYDHLLDVPWVMSRHTPKAKLYGSDSVVHMLKAMADPDRAEDDHWTRVDPARVFSAQKAMATIQTNSTRPGEWIYSSGQTIRAMPIQSEHAGHILGIDLVPGEYTADLTEVPTSVFKWKPGQSLAWLIDLLDDQKQPVYRIHYQDSAASPPYGFPPVLSDCKAIDVEILSVGSWQQVDKYPNELLKLTRPRLVLLGHWERFFGNDPGKPESLRWQNEAGMVRAIHDSVPVGTLVRMPAPFAEIALPTA
ncbi:hypothetical protein [Pseudomonas sp. NPDC096950]|uniref:hypothetical protein n=1 Tax=Pseudomonas sp. NPDC096950 TaxID=3364485 RepID=UPI00383B7ED0